MRPGGPGLVSGRSSPCGTLPAPSPHAPSPESVPVLQPVARATHGHAALTAWLLEQGADAGFGDRRNHSPLHGAAFSGHCDTMILLLDAGAALDVKTTDGDETPLSWAVEQGQAGAVKLLLERGAAANEVLIQQAQEYGHDDVVALLRAARG